MNEYGNYLGPRDLQSSGSVPQFSVAPEVTIGAETDTLPAAAPYDLDPSIDDVDTSCIGSGYDAYGEPQSVPRAVHAPRVAQDAGDFIVIARGDTDYVYRVVRDDSGNETILTEPIDIIDNGRYRATLARYTGSAGLETDETTHAGYTGAFDDTTIDLTDPDDIQPAAYDTGGGFWGDSGYDDPAYAAEDATDGVDDTTIDLATDGVSESTVPVHSDADVQADNRAAAGDPAQSIEQADTPAVPAQAVPQSHAAETAAEPTALPDATPEHAAHAGTVLQTVQAVTETYMAGRQYVEDRAGIFVPARPEHIAGAIQAAGPQPGKKYMDIGSGDGRWPIVAGEVLGMQSVGCELSAERHEVAQAALAATVADGVATPEQAARVTLVQRNFFDMDLSGVDIFTYADGSGPAMAHVAEQLVREADPGARLVVYGASEQQLPGMDLVTSHTAGPGIMVRVYKIRRYR